MRIRSPNFDFPCCRYGPLFKTSLLGRPVVVLTDPEFSYNLLLQDGKLVDRWHFTPTSQVVSYDDGKPKASIDHVYKCLTRLLLGRFGHEPLKNGTLMAELQDTIAMSLQRWSQLPRVNLKVVIPTVIKESLRIASVAPGILRRTLTDIDIDGKLFMYLIV
ncbi:Cytochrome P450 87A3 [Linum perenne]